MQEFCCAGEFAASVGSEDVIGDRIVGGKCARVEDGWQVGAVVDVEMGEEDDVEFVEIEIELADFDEGAGASIDEDSRGACDRDDIAGFAAAGGAGTAGAEDDQFHCGLGVGGAFFRRSELRWFLWRASGARVRRGDRCAHYKRRENESRHNKSATTMC